MALPNNQNMTVPTWAQIAAPDIAFTPPDYAVSGQIPTLTANALSVPYGLFQFTLDGYREHFGEGDDQEVSFVIDVAWGQLPFLRQFLKGYTYVNPIPSGEGIYSLVRSPSYQCPMPGYEHLYCSTFAVEHAEGAVSRDPSAILVAAGNVPGDLPALAPWPAWVDRSTATAGNAKCRVTCRPRNFVVRDNVQLALANAATNIGELNRYVTREPSQAIQSLPLPNGTLKYTDGLTPRDISNSANYLLMPTMPLRYVWHQVPSPPWDAVQTCAGKVNSDVFDPGNYIQAVGWPAQTLL